MKKLEFESNGSKWLLLCANNREDYYLNTRVIDNPNGRVGNGVSLCMITEEQASEVVEAKYKQGKLKCYFDYCKGRYTHSLFTAIESLYSLLKSKGVYLYESAECDNYFCDNSRIDMSYGEYTNCLECENIEENTFYNPILFKILS